MSNIFSKINYKILTAIIAVFLIISASLAIRDWPAVKYEIRKLNIQLFQGGEIAGGRITQLSAIYHRQEHALSCEIAALKMALSVVGSTPSESELISKLKFDPTPRSKTIWGDPFTGFVGDIDGKMGQNGYGVYWDPIAAVGNQYASASVMQFDAKKLASEIEAGNAVVAWGYSGRGKKIIWTTPDGKQITAINGEHARTIIGFNGSVDAPTGFIILDPIYGRLYWKTQDLMNNWAPFDHMGVVISKS